MTGRELIVSALRTSGAIGEGQQPTHEMFADGLEALNMLLDTWSADELMPYDIVQHETGLLLGVPNYTINAGAAWDSDSICVNQQPSAGGTQSLAINGALASSGVATPGVPRPIVISSTGDESARTFAVTGTNHYGDTISESIVGPNATTVRSVYQYKTITGITIDGNAAGIITVGVDYIINVRRPLMIVDAFVRSATGLDEPVFPIDRERYIEIADKDESGMPTKFYYRQSYPSGEIYVHPVPSGGQSLSASVGSTEHITNGNFSAGTSWTLGSQWSIAGGKLVRTPGQGGAILGDELITDGGFAADLSSWPTSGDQWSWDSGTAKRVPGTGDPILSGVELTTNGTFTGSASGWNLSNASYLSNRANIYHNGTSIISQVLTGPGPTDEVYVSYTIGDNATFGTPVFGGTSKVYTYMGGNLGANNTSAGTIGEVLAFGNGNLEITGVGGGGSNYLICGIDTVSVQAVTGYESQGPDSLTQAVAGLTNGATYRVTYTISNRTAGNITLKVGGTSGTTRTTNDTFTEDVVAGADGTISFYAADGDFDGSIDDVSIKEITGYEELGADSAKQLSADLATAFVSGSTYRLAFTVSSFSAGTCTPSIGSTNGTVISADGTYSMDIICGSGADFELAASSSFSGSFDDISVFKVTDTATGTTQYTLFVDLWLPFKTITSFSIDTAINLPGEYLLALKWDLAYELLSQLGKQDNGFIRNRAKMYTDVIRRINTRMPQPTMLWPVLPVIERKLAVNMN